MQQALYKRISKKPPTALKCNPEQWIKEHQNYLFSYALRRLKDRETAQDIVQESFLAALEHLEKFRYDSSERTWLVAILKNKIADHFRKPERKFVDISVLNDTQQYSERNAVNYDFFPIINKAVKKLPDLWQAVFTMRHFEDQPTQAICQKLQITTSNYWVINYRTRLNLRNNLRAHL